MNWKLFGTVLCLFALFGCAPHKSLCRYPAPPPELMRPAPPPGSFQAELDRVVTSGQTSTERPSGPTP